MNCFQFFGRRKRGASLSPFSRLHYYSEAFVQRALKHDLFWKKAEKWEFFFTQNTTYFIFFDSRDVAFKGHVFAHFHRVVSQRCQKFRLIHFQRLAWNKNNHLSLQVLFRKKVDEAKAVIFFREKAFFRGVKKCNKKSSSWSRKDNIWHTITCAVRRIF